MAEVYLIRHGERLVIPDYLIRVKGIPDSSLSDKGKKQAKELAKKLIKLKIDRVYVSTKKRAI